MCTGTPEINSIVDEICEIKEYIESLELEMEQLTDKVKQFMGEEETLIAGSRKVCYKTIVSKRVDTVALKKLLGEEALQPYTKLITSRRFSIN